MTTYALPSVTPNNSVFEYVANNAVFQSPLSGHVQVVARGGDFWRVQLFWQHLKGADKAVLKAWLASLEGMRHRVTFYDQSQIQRGAFGGSPVVDGGSQLGNQLSVQNATSGVTNWIRAGDMFGVNGELKMCTQDANSDGSGNVLLNFVPALRLAPDNNEPIVTSNPTGTFMLADTDVGWSNRPGDFSDFTATFVEDIAA